MAYLIMDAPNLILRRNGKIGKPVLPKTGGNAVYIKDIPMRGTFYITEDGNKWRICFVKCSAHGAQVLDIDNTNGHIHADQVFPDDFPLYRS